MPATRKLYNDLAERLGFEYRVAREIEGDEPTASALLRAVEVALKIDNPAFDAGRFVTAITKAAGFDVWSNEPFRKEVK